MDEKDLRIQQLKRQIEKLNEQIEKLNEQSISICTEETEEKEKSR